jgi:hypothetical protein
MVTGFASKDSCWVLNIEWAFCLAIEKDEKKGVEKCHSGARRV